MSFSLSDVGFCKLVCGMVTVEFFERTQCMVLPYNGTPFKKFTAEKNNVGEII